MGSYVAALLLMKMGYNDGGLNCKFQAAVAACGWAKITHQDVVDGLFVNEAGSFFMGCL
ncbi:hypothetical protein Dimus_013294 [Dionaea muscipula]